MEVREAVPVHVSSKFASLMWATLLYYWMNVGLSSPFTVPGQPINFSRASISTNTVRSSVGRGVRCFIISICSYRKQQQSSPLSHFRGVLSERTDRSICNCCQFQGSVFVQGGEHELLSCEVQTKTDVGALVPWLCILLHRLLGLWSFSQCFGSYKEATVFIHIAVVETFTKITTLFFYSSDSHPFSLTRP